MQPVLTVGDAGVPNTDASYEGEQGTSLVSPDYVRAKITEFQSVMNGLDASWQAARAALSVTDSEELSAYLMQWLDDFDAKRWTMRTTAEALNMGAAVVNAAGGRMPSLSIPATLGLGPVALPVVAIAALATAATLIAWGVTAIQGLNERLKFQQAIDAQDSPEKAAQLASSVMQSDAAVRTAEAQSGLFGLSGIGSAATVLKWGAVAGLGWLAWKHFLGPMLARRSNPDDDSDD